MMGTKKANPGELTPFAYSRTIRSGQKTNERHCITAVPQTQPNDCITSVIQNPHSNRPVRGTIDSLMQVKACIFCTVGFLVTTTNATISAIMHGCFVVSDAIIGGLCLTGTNPVCGMTTTQCSFETSKQSIQSYKTSKCNHRSNEKAEAGLNPQESVIPIRDHTAHCPRAYHRTWPSTAYDRKGRRLRFKFKLGAG